MKELWFVQSRFNAILMAPFIETDLAAGCWQKKLGKHFPFTQDQVKIQMWEIQKWENHSQNKYQFTSCLFPGNEVQNRCNQCL